VDLVGYGTANAYETAAAGALTNTSGSSEPTPAAPTRTTTPRISRWSSLPRRGIALRAALLWKPTALDGAVQDDPNPVYAGATVMVVVTVYPGANPSSTGISVVGDLSALGGAAASRSPRRARGQRLHPHPDYPVRQQHRH
jgi:hypothetical protein